MGLMPTPGQAPQQQAPAQGQPQDGSQDQESNVSPEEQAQYDEVMKRAADIIYGDGHVMPEILKALEPAKDAPQAPQGDGDGADAESSQEDAGEAPAASQGADDQAPKGNPAVLALANAATQVVQKLDVSSQQAGFKIDNDVLYHAGSEIVGMLAEVAEHAGIHNYSEDEIQGAFFQAIDNYRPIAERMGRTSQDQLKGEFGEIQQADQQGKLGEVLPGMQSEGEQPGQ